MSNYKADEEDENFELVDYTAASSWEKFIAAIERKLCELKVDNGRRGDFDIGSLEASCRKLLVKHKQYQSAVRGQVSRLCTKTVRVAYKGITYALTLSVHPILKAASDRCNGSRQDVFDATFPPTHVPELEIDHSQSEQPEAWHPLHRWTRNSAIIYLHYQEDFNTDDDDSFDIATPSSGNYSVSLDTSKHLMSSFNIAARNAKCHLPIFIPVGDAWRCLFTGTMFRTVTTDEDHEESKSSATALAVVEKYNSAILDQNVPASYLQLGGLLDIYISSYNILDRSCNYQDSPPSNNIIVRGWENVSKEVNLAALHTYRIKNSYDRKWNISSPDFGFGAGDLHVGPSNDPLRLLTLNALFQTAPCGMYIDSQSPDRSNLYLKTASAWSLTANMIPADRERTMLTETLEDAFAAWSQSANESHRHRHLKLSEQMEAHAEITSNMLVDLFGNTTESTLCVNSQLRLGATEMDADETERLERLERTISDVYGNMKKGQRRPASVSQLIGGMEHGVAVPYNSLLWRLSEILLVATAKRSADFWRAPSIMTFLRLLWAMALKEIRWRWEHSKLLPKIRTSAEHAAEKAELKSGTGTPLFSTSTTTPANESQASGDVLPGVSATKYEIHLQYALIHQKLEMLNCCVERKRLRDGDESSQIDCSPERLLSIANTTTPDADSLVNRIRTHIKEQIGRRVKQTGGRESVRRLLRSMRPLAGEAAAAAAAASSSADNSGPQTLWSEVDEFEEIEDPNISDSEGFVSAEDEDEDVDEDDNGTTQTPPIRLPPNAVKIAAPSTDDSEDEASARDPTYVDVAISSSVDSASGFHHVSDIYEREQQLTPTVTKDVEVDVELADGERQGELYSSETLCLLETGDPLWIPRIQIPPVLTEDMLRERETILMGFGTSIEGARLRAQLQCADLISDMESFKAANPGCVLADFVRWHSPRDWIVPEGCSEREGHLSMRMSGRKDNSLGNGDDNLWQRLWSQARRIPADKQKLLFDHEIEAEKALHFLEGIPVYSLFSSLLPTMFLIAYDRLYRQPIVHRMGFLRERLIELGKKISVQMDWSLSSSSAFAEAEATVVDPDNPMYSAIMDTLEELEIQTSRCVSLLFKFPGQYSLVETLVTKGQCLVDDRKQQRVVFKALSKHNILANAPACREYVFTSKHSSDLASLAELGQQQMYVAIKDERSVRIVHSRVSNVNQIMPV